MPQQLLSPASAIPTSTRLPGVAWVLLFVGFSCLALSATTAGIYEAQPLVMVALVGVGFAGLAYWNQPGLGLIVLIPAVLLPDIPLRVGTTVSIAFLVTPFLFGAWLLCRKKSSQNATWAKSRAFLPLSLLALCSLLGLLAGQYPWLPAAGAPVVAQVAGLGVFLSSAAAFVVAAHEFRNLRLLERAVQVLLVVGAILLVLPLVSLTGYLPADFLGERSIGSLFWTWLMSFACAQALANERLTRRWRFTSIGVMVGALYLTLGLWSDWASGWLPGCVAILTVVALRYWRVAVTILVIGLIVTLSSTAVTESVWTANQQYSATTRLAAAEVSWQLATINPITGLGPANYYYYTPLYPILGWYVKFSSHNNYIDVLLQTGLCGLVCLLWLLVELGTLGWKIRKRATQGFARAYVLGALGGLAGTATAGLLGDWFLPFVYNVGLQGFASSVLGWVFLGGLVAVQQNVCANSQTEGSSWT